MTRIRAATTTGALLAGKWYCPTFVCSTSIQEKFKKWQNISQSKQNFLNTTVVSFFNFSIFRISIQNSHFTRNLDLKWRIQYQHFYDDICAFYLVGFCIYHVNYVDLYFSVKSKVVTEIKIKTESYLASVQFVSVCQIISKGV